MKRKWAAVVGVVAIGVVFGVVRRAGVGRATGGDAGQVGCGGPISPETEPAESGAQAVLDSPAAITAEAGAVQERALGTYGAAPSVRRLPASMRPPAALAIHSIKSYSRFAGIDPNQIRLTGTRIHNGRTELSVRQMVGKVPVFGAEARVVVDGANHKQAIYGTLYPDIQMDVVLPTLTSDEAIGKAIASIGCGDCEVAKARSWLLVLHRNNETHLAYRVWPRLDVEKETYPMVFVDAHAGNVLFTCKRGEDPACFDQHD